MKRILSLVLAVLMIATLNAQTFQKKQFRVNSSGAKLWGILYLPEGYQESTGTYPIMVFCHGVGEAGSSEASAEALYAHGPLGFAKAGHRMEFTNPADGKQYRYILFALQDPSWSPSASEIAYALKNDVFPAYKIDRSRVIVTGLSAGGASTLEAITTTGALEIFTAAVPMSPASSGNTANIAATAAAGIRSMGFSGNADGSFTENLNAFTAKLNQTAPGTARSYIYLGAHGGWSTFYDPAYKSNLWGGQLSIYEFGLASARGSTWVPAPPPPTTVKAAFNVEDGAIITTSAFEVDASASENVRPDWEGYLWGVKPIQGGSWGAQPQGGAYGGVKKNIINLTNGTYQLSLTVKGINGQTNTRAINFTVNLGGTQPPPAGKKISTFKVEVINGNIVITISYTDGTTQTIGG